MCPWRIILRNTEEKGDVYEAATHIDQCCLPVIKYKNFLTGSDTETEISFHSIQYTTGLNLNLEDFFFVEIHYILKTSPDLPTLLPSHLRFEKRLSPFYQLLQLVSSVSSQPQMSSTHYPVPLPT